MTCIAGNLPANSFPLFRKTGLGADNRSGDMEPLAKGKPDFVGVNYYQTITYERNPLDGVSEGKMNTTGQKGTNQETGIPGVFKTKKSASDNEQLGLDN